MSHPLINDLSKFTLEEIQDKISSLNKNLNFAIRNQNSSMVNQIRMILEDYRSAYNTKMDEVYKNKNIDNRININRS